MPDRLRIGGLADAPGTIGMADGRIVTLGDEAVREDEGVTVIDGTGLTAHPGFIELQVNGIEGFDFSADPSSIPAAGAALARHGVTSYLPTIVTGPRGRVEAALDVLADLHDTGGAVPIGLHVEGPFISPMRRGAHDAAHIRDPDLDEIRGWLAGGARMVITLAPELPGALDAIEAVVAAGAIAAIGHTDADAEVTARAVDAGARYATHLFNAMPPFEHRRPGAVGALLADERVTVGVIADGIHLDPLVLALVARAAVGRVSLVSDAVATGLGGHPLTHGPRAPGRLAENLDRRAEHLA